MPDYTDDIYKGFADLPSCRIRIDMGDGGENLWGKELPDGNYALDNDPVHGEWRWQDIVGSRSLSDEGQLLYRRWKGRVYYTYDVAGDDASKQALWRALSELGKPALSYMGMGMVLLKEEDGAEEKVAEILSRFPKAGAQLWKARKARKRAG